MMEIQESSRWGIRRVQDEETGVWLPERQLYTVVHAYCDAHSLQSMTVENWSMLHPEEDAQRWADEHNEAMHPRQIAKRRRREATLNEVVGPLVRELALDPVEPADTEQWGDAPLLKFPYSAVVSHLAQQRVDIHPPRI